MSEYREDIVIMDIEGVTLELLGEVEGMHLRSGVSLAEIFTRVIKNCQT